MSPFEIAQLIMIAPKALESIVALIEALRRLGDVSPERVQQALMAAHIPDTPEGWLACLTCAETNQPGLPLSDDPPKESA